MVILPSAIQSVVENAEVGGELKQLGQARLSGYEGDGVYDEEDMKLTSQLMVELDKLNKVSA
jgi:hypothetical protein